MVEGRGNRHQEFFKPEFMLGGERNEKGKN
jgi:hypothetical protein